LGVNDGEDRGKTGRTARCGVGPTGKSWEWHGCHLGSDLGWEFGVHRGGKGPREGWEKAGWKGRRRRAVMRRTELEAKILCRGYQLPGAR
jgi:hypothetical protein